MIFLALLLLILGFVALIKGADLLVDGASALAFFLGISPIVIGLTIVSFGTSAPELMVNIFAALKGNAAISFGNILGSNIINILLILGIAGLVRPLKTQKSTVWREIPFSLLAVFVFFLMCNDHLFGPTVSQLSRNDGLLLVLFFIIFIFYTFGIPKLEQQEAGLKTLSKVKIVIFIVLGLLGLFIGGKLVVDNAIKIAHFLGASEKIIGLTVVAFGTSLPELATSAVAAYKNKFDIAIGNVVGSNIFNIFFILAITSIISPLSYDTSLNIDVFVLLIASMLLFFSMFTGQKHKIDRWEATLFLFLYFCYFVFCLFRH